MANDDALTDEQITQRFTTIETGMAEQKTTLERILGALQGGAKPPAAPAGDQGQGDVGAAVRAELARAGKEDQDARYRSMAEAAAATAEDLRRQVAELREAPPAEPVRRIEGLMGWRG